MKSTRVSIDDILERLTIDQKPEEVAEGFEIPLVAVHDGLRPVSKAMERIIVIVEAPSI